MTARRIFYLLLILAAVAGVLWLVFGRSEAPVDAQASLPRSAVTAPPGYPDVFDPAFQRGLLTQASRSAMADIGVQPLTEVKGALGLHPWCFMPRSSHGFYAGVADARLSAFNHGRVVRRFEVECNMSLYQARIGGRTMSYAIYRLPGSIPAEGAVIGRVRDGEASLVIAALPQDAAPDAVAAYARKLANDPKG